MTAPSVVARWSTWAPELRSLLRIVAATLDAVIAHSGAVAQPVGADAPEITARFRDPAGNVVGLYQEPGR